MKISHSIKNISGQDIIYIYVTVNDIYEFGKENLGKGENSNFLTKLKNYISNNIKDTKKAAAVIVINGVVIGSLTLGTLMKSTNVEAVQETNEVVKVYTENDKIKNASEIRDEEKIETKTEETKANEKKEEKNEVAATIKKQIKTNTTNTKSTSNKTSTNTTKPKTASKVTTSNSKSSSSTTASNTTNTKTPTKTTNKSTKTTNNNASSNTNTNSNTKNTTSTSNNTSSSTNTTTSTSQTTTVSSGVKIKFNNGGVISNIDLEEYVIGVVAAEMPASFNIEALKAQAITARTYAMKKHSKGITLINSTAHQVYYSEAQMKSMWGSSYSTYYNKIKNAVNSTKGQVLKYGGEYIEALFYSISNGKSELPKYVWNNNYPYLQAVSSSWDVGLSAAKYSINMTYEKMSDKLGVTVNKNSEIKILSRTEGDRVNKISIAGKVFIGVEVRTKLGLRSADFTIKQNDNNVTISTIGYGHGVGMSQYGANGAAKAGMTYRQILSHYYPGTSLVSI